jgi:membrane-associated phospholipid phosphatase
MKGVPMTRGVVLLLLTILFAPPALAQQAQDTQAPPPVVVASEEPATLGSAIRELPRSARHLGDRANLIAIATAGAVALSLAPSDARIIKNIAGSRLDTALDPGDVIGNGFTQFAVALGTLAAGQLSHRPAVATTGAELIDAQIISGIATQTIKYAARRRRPSGGPHSFPSGHASAAFATASVIQRRFGWKAGAPLYALGGYVAVSRLQENQHYLSDVVFGAALGIVAGRASVHSKKAGLTAAFVPLGRGLAVVVVRQPAR